MSKEALTALIAASWKTIDKETLDYCKKLSSLVKRQREVMEAAMARSEALAAVPAKSPTEQGTKDPMLWQNLKLPDSLKGPPAKKQKTSSESTTEGDTTKQRAPLKKRPVPSCESVTSPSSLPPPVVNPAAAVMMYPHAAVMSLPPAAMNLPSLPPWALVQLARSTSWPPSLSMANAALAMSNTARSMANTDFPMTTTVRNVSTDSRPQSQGAAGVRSEDDCLAAEALHLIRYGAGDSSKKKEDGSG